MALNKTTYNSVEKIWSGPNEEPLEYSGLSVGQVFYKQMKANPQNICQISDSDGTSLTNDEMLKISIRIAQNLNTAQGIIGIMTSCSTYQAPVLYACMLNGTAFQAINPKHHKQFVVHLLSLSRPEIMFCDVGDYESLVAACKDINLKPTIFTIDGCIEGVPSVHDLMKPTGNEEIFCPRDCSNDEFDTAAILCSSGTTGLPKGVCFSHMKILKTFKKKFIEAGSIIFTFSNVDWTSGLGYLTRTFVSSCTKICTTEQFSPQKLRQVIEKYKVNYCTMRGSYLTQFIKSGEADLCDFSSLRKFIITGDHISHSMYVKLQSLIKCGSVVNFYGGSEFGAVSCTSSTAKPYSVGQLCEGFKIRIVDDRGVNLGVGETGEILVQHELKWRGYISNPIETKKVFDKDAWFHTADVGYFDEDGDLYLVDREKHIIRYNGSHYSPREIVNCILELNSVAEVCVFGTRSEKFGDLPAALIKKKPGSNISIEDIENYIAKELPESRWLHGGLFFVEEIPKNTNGKYVPTKAKEIFDELKYHVLNI